MNIKLKAALLTLGTLLGFAGILIVGDLFPMITGMILFAISLAMVFGSIYHLILYFLKEAPRLKN